MKDFRDRDHVGEPGYNAWLWEDCEHCLDGFVGHDCGEDTCCCLNPQDNILCQVCDGEGGWEIDVDGKPVHSGGASDG